MICGFSVTYVIDYPWAAAQAERPPQEFPTRLESAEDDKVRYLSPNRVPYITQWSAEAGWRGRVVLQHRGIGYADEMPWDRDERGVLWARVPSRPGQGRPEFGKVHGQRQRLAMTRLLCQVCGRPANRTSDGLLWLVGEDPHDPASWPDPLLTSHPPVCTGCAEQSVRVCPHLRNQHVALRVRTFELAGVRGALYRPGNPDPIGVNAVQMTFDNPRIGWVKAGQLIMKLRDFTPTELSTGDRP
jgi:hypothetical protein